MAKAKPDATHVFRQFAWNLAGMIAGRKTRVSPRGGKR